MNIRKVSLRSYVLLLAVTALAIHKLIQQDFLLHTNAVVLWFFMLALTSIIQDFSKPDIGLLLLGSVAILSLFFTGESGLYFFVPITCFFLSSFFYVTVAIQLIKECSARDI